MSSLGRNACHDTLLVLGQASTRVLSTNISNTSPHACMLCMCAHVLCAVMDVQATQYQVRDRIAMAFGSCAIQEWILPVGHHGVAIPELDASADLERVTPRHRCVPWCRPKSDRSS